MQFERLIIIDANISVILDITKANQVTNFSDLPSETTLRIYIYTHFSLINIWSPVYIEVVPGSLHQFQVLGVIATCKNNQTGIVTPLFYCPNDHPNFSLPQWNLL